MFTERKAEEILQEQENEYFEEMASDAEKDFRKLEVLANECFESMLDNKIYIVDNEKIFKTNIIGKDLSIGKFGELIELLRHEEDFLNCQVYVKEKNYNEPDIKGFTVFYPQYEKNDISSIKVEIVESVSEFIEKVIYNEKELKNKKTFYRGHGDWRYDLLPGIYRPQNEHILLNESEYIKEIISSYPQYFMECKAALDYLSVLQHNGFPTRLLDFSENPLIALYMACNNDSKNHADTMKITVPKEYFKYYDSDTVSILANIAFAEDDFSIKDFNHIHHLEESLNIEEFNRRTDVTKLVHLIRNEKPAFKQAIDPKHLNGDILFVKPRRVFDRISHQSGLFALFGISGSKKDMPKIEYLSPPCDITHYIIPSYLKGKVLEELSRINITEANVYCDMEHVAKHYINKAKNKEIEKIIEENEKKEQEFSKSLFK